MDDEKLNLKLLQSVLVPEGYEFQGAENGEAALGQVAQDPPDLILLDIMMPKISGFEVLQKLRADEKTRLIPVVMVTALRETKDRVKALEAGCDDFISKPFDKVELLARVKSLLRIKQYRSQLAEKKNAFVTNVSHEFGTPITIMKGLLENIRDGLNGPVTLKQGESLDMMIRTVDRVSRLTRDMLDISKIEAGKLKLEYSPVDLAKILSDVTSAFITEAKKKEITVQKEIPSKPVLFRGDEDRSTQVFVNLVSNAVKYTPVHGRVTVRLMERPEANLVHAEVEDTGPGIPEDQRERIFDKFTRITAEKQEGTGLGLPIAKDLVVLQGGRIWVEPAGEKGSRFVVELPQQRKAPA